MTESKQANNLVIVGMKNAGKSTLADALASKLHKERYSIDSEIEAIYKREHGTALHCREIFVEQGPERFRALETRALRGFVETALDNSVIDCGGGIAETAANHRLLGKLGTVIWLQLDPDINFERMRQNGLPSFAQTKSEFLELLTTRSANFAKVANISVPVNDSSETTDETADRVIELISKYN